MYDTDQKMLYRVYACFCLVLLCIALYVGCAGGAGTNGVQGSADREIGRIEEQQRQADAEISRVGTEIGAAEDALGRADGAVSNSQKRVAAMQEGVGECEAILKECQELAGRNAKIIGELREQIGSRARATGK